jgi:hypothetical protein
MRMIRNLAEFVVLFALWGLMVWLISGRWLGNIGLSALVVGLAWSKTAFFGAENLRDLWQASQQNIPYHRFMLLMLMNMAQIITSFAFDFHCLHEINPASFGNVAEIATEPKLVFEFFYYSVLNFTFFGYGDVTPQTIPAKLLTMTEILLAFVTVIFLLSDFISLKESIRQPRQNEWGADETPTKRESV